jgi:precorrin-6B methylase 2
MHANDRNRSLRLATLQPLLGVEGVQFVSLQKGAPAEELKGLPVQMRPLEIGEELSDFGDTAAVVAQLDLVICVDTAVAHLAGALGKAVWVLLPTPADWRWLEGREDSPWYPTMRLFRQQVRGEWGEVIERMQAALAQWVQDGAPQPVLSNVKQVLPQLPPPVLPRNAPGHRPGFSAVAECRDGILQYLPDEPDEGDSLGWYGEYLQHQLTLLGRIIRPGSTLLEAGAGVGAHALFLSAAAGETGHVYLYESRPVMQRILRQNLAANRIGNVTLMRRALGRPVVDAPTLLSDTLDDLRLERLDWLKMGTSVAALEVLEGASDTLWRLRPMMYLAAADAQALEAIAERVREYSYRCWRMEVPLFNHDNFNRRDNDLFAGRTALALLAIPEEVDVDVTLKMCAEIL